MTKLDTITSPLRIIIVFITLGSCCRRCLCTRAATDEQQRVKLKTSAKDEIQPMQNHSVKITLYIQGKNVVGNWHTFLLLFISIYSAAGKKSFTDTLEDSKKATKETLADWCNVGHPSILFSLTASMGLWRGHTQAETPLITGSTHSHLRSVSLTGPVEAPHREASGMSLTHDLWDARRHCVGNRRHHHHHHHCCL